MALLAAVVGMPAAVSMLSRQTDDDAPTDRQRKMMRAVSQLVVPRTGTPGAGDVGVGDFVILALEHGLDGTRRPAASDALPPLAMGHMRPDGSLRFVAWLEAELDRAANGDWIGKPEARRAALLTKLDADAYAAQGDHPWKKVKGLILTGYYTSETGGARELNYELTPGLFDPAVAIKPGARAYSSDWTAVDFG
ncbi:gluconate 2-dehydrogenase subunit 3 family protein [Sphingomonas sp. ST-64]|uniref:Gluconate 2-dehydrogenase subunit 3 family protein n=1 Tax=Sphingomonas plantiphila TaxID=3163295 RepID=A0ABW8YKB7_9SPHN